MAAELHNGVTAAMLGKVHMKCAGLEVLAPIVMKNYIF
jgi:hypothetical protein